jgi:D-glycero-D-manno-heptose 1,7-bisphosphate phosphatase
MANRALFLDRDGVINVDYAYVHKAEKFVFNNGIFDVVREANRNSVLVIVVTNQSGIGRGYFTEATFHELMHWVKQQFIKHGARIDGVYFSPFHPIHGIGPYRRDSNCRKPSPGMLHQAIREHDINCAQSLLVGDRHSDLIAGKAVGISTLLHYCPKQSIGVDTDFITPLFAASTRIGDLREVIPYLNLQSR